MVPKAAKGIGPPVKEYGTRHRQTGRVTPRFSTTGSLFPRRPQMEGHYLYKMLEDIFEASFLLSQWHGLTHTRVSAFLGEDVGSSHR